VRNISPLGTTLRFLPAPVSGVLTNVVVGLIVHRVRGDWIVIMATAPCAIGSLLMAVVNPTWSYWACDFIANFLNPIGADVIFTVSNLLITSVFPPNTQGVAGGVFNTISQTGKSVDLALTALVANEVTANFLSIDKLSPKTLLIGYRTAFWFCVALTVASLCVSI
jgi:nitrate/nitrite transporter NarK